MTDDALLLKGFAEKGSEADFAALVQRHLRLVYGAAERQLRGDSHLAQDVSQIVFTTLARKAASLQRHPILTGWLYTTTRYAVAEVKRAERRRQIYEHVVSAMQETSRHDGEFADWEELRPVLDEVLFELNERDREAVLLRFFESRPFADLAARLATTEDAARMRVERALTKMHRTLRRRGITSTVSALGVVLAGQPAVAAPVQLVCIIANGALTGAKAGAGGLALWHVFFMGKLSTAIVGVVILTGASVALLQQQSRAQLQEEISFALQDNREAIRLRAMNSRLAQLTTGPLESARSNELARLRAEAAVLDTLASASTGRELRLTGGLQDMGSASPELAYESTLWAKKNRDTTALSRLIEIHPDAKFKADAFYARLPAGARGDADSSEKLIATALIWDSHTRELKNVPEKGDETALKTADSIRFQTTDESSDTVAIQMVSATGEPVGIVRRYHQTPAGWREVIPAGQVHKIIHSY